MINLEDNIKKFFKRKLEIEEIETEEKVEIKNDENSEKEDEVNPIMQKYSDFISFSTKLEKQGFYSNPFNKENGNQ